MLLVVGALGTLPPTAHRHGATSEIQRDAAFIHIQAGETMAEVTINPGRAGRATATIRVLREDSSNFAVKEVWLAIDPPRAGMTSIERVAVRRPDRAWQVDGIDIGQPGIWTVRVIER